MNRGAVEVIEISLILGEAPYGGWRLLNAGRKIPSKSSLIVKRKYVYLYICPRGLMTLMRDERDLKSGQPMLLLRLKKFEFQETRRCRS